MYMLIFAYPWLLGLFFTLILAGPTCSLEGRFWVVEPFYTFSYLMVECAVISALVGMLYKSLENMKPQLIGCKTVFTFFLFVFLLFQIFFVFLYENKYINFNKNIKLSKEEFYREQKIMMFAYYLNKPIPVFTNYVHKDYIVRLLHSLNNIVNEKTKIEEQEEIYIEFFELGGCFTEEEIQHIKFERLKDKDFVLCKNKMN